MLKCKKCGSRYDVEEAKGVVITNFPDEYYDISCGLCADCIFDQLQDEYLELKRRQEFFDEYGEDPFELEQ